MPITMELEERIAASPERVFAALTDLESMGKWMPNYVRVELLTPGAIGVGTRFRETRKMFGKEASEEFEVTSLEPPRELGLYVDGSKGSSKRGEYRFRHTLEPDGTGTILRLSGEVSGMGFFGELFGWLFSGMMKKAIAKDMAALKKHVESAG